VIESQIEIVNASDSPGFRVLEAVDLAVEVTMQSSEMLQGVYWGYDRLGDDELAHIEAALVQLRAHLVSCERTFVQFLDRRR
jgi:hypothetical protein